MDDALTVATGAIEALNRGEWERAARATDPDDVERWYRSHAERKDVPPRTLTAEQVKRHSPDLPDAVAEYQAAEFNRHQAENRGSLHGEFAGIETRAQLAALSATEALARYLQAQDPSWQFQRRLDALDPRLAPYARQGTLSRVREVVGVVHEGASVAHVVYRARLDVGEAEGGRESTMHVATLREGPDGWRLRLRGELFEHGGMVTIVEPPEDGDDR